LALARDPRVVGLSRIMLAPFGDGARVPLFAEATLRHLDRDRLREHAQLIYGTIGARYNVLAPELYDGDLADWIVQVLARHVEPLKPKTSSMDIFGTDFDRWDGDKVTIPTSADIFGDAKTSTSVPDIFSDTSLPVFGYTPKRTTYLDPYGDKITTRTSTDTFGDRKTTRTVRDAFGDTSKSTTYLDPYGDKITTKTTTDIFGDRKTTTTVRDAWGDKTSTTTATDAYGDKMTTRTSKDIFGNTTKSTIFRDAYGGKVVSASFSGPLGRGPLGRTVRSRSVSVFR